MGDFYQKTKRSDRILYGVEVHHYDTKCVTQGKLGQVQNMGGSNTSLTA